MEKNIYYHDYKDGSWFRIHTKYCAPAEKEVTFVEMKAQKMKPFAAALYDINTKKDLLKEMHNAIGEHLKLEDATATKEKFDKGFPKKCARSGEEFIAKSPAAKFCNECDECKNEAKAKVKETENVQTQ